MLTDETLRLTREATKAIKDIAKSQKEVERQLKIMNRLKAIELSGSKDIMILSNANREFLAEVATTKVD